MKKTILILNGQYLPGYKGGGPIQSCVNMVENLYKTYDFKILCADRDYKEEKSYENIKIDQWNKVGHAHVYYASPQMQTMRGLENIINDTKYDVIYLNGFFSPIFTIKPLVLRLLGRLKNRGAKIILTPRGDFTGGCENKKLKKYAYINLVKMIGLYKNITWHATSDLEKHDIDNMFHNANIFTVSNLPAKFVAKVPVISKAKGELRLVFVSRIFPKKNLKFALEILKHVTNGSVVFDIYGPMEDKSYWRECEAVIDEMPPNIQVKYCGEVSHAQVPHVFEQYHAFFFPTLGENYGHVIVEAMMNNCLCVLSKHVTPWDDYSELLNLGAELKDKNAFVEIINKLIQLDKQGFTRMLKMNNQYVVEHFVPEKDMARYIDMFGGK